MRLILLTIIALATGLWSCVVVDSMLAVNCVDHLEQTAQLTIPNDDAAVQFQLDRCELDSEACTMLCMASLQRLGVGNPVTHCKVVFSATVAVLHISFDQATNAPGCGTMSNGSGLVDADVFPPVFDGGGMPGFDF